MRRRSLTHVTTSVWHCSVVPLLIAACACGKRADADPAGTRAVPSSGILLADPLAAPSAAKQNPIPIPLPARGDAKGALARCPRRLEQAITSCGSTEMDDGLATVWLHWRMCAEVAGLTYEEADSVHMRVSVSQHQAKVSSTRSTAGIPPPLLACLSGAIRAARFAQVAPCEANLSWSPLAKPDCDSKAGEKE